jgi:hypothetical protein
MAKGRQGVVHFPDGPVMFFDSCSQVEPDGVELSTQVGELIIFLDLLN